MRIVYCASECTPYASTGGLAEVVADMPIALTELGHETSRIMPMYRQVLESDAVIRHTGMKMSIPLGFRNLHCEIYEHVAHGVTTYFIRRDEYFDRATLYGSGDREYDDNSDRFIFFQKAAVELIDRLQLQPDIVHAHDWQTGLIPLYLQHGITGQGRENSSASVFTIHNLAYQGVYSGNEFPTTGLPFSCFTMSSMEYHGSMSFLKAGLTSADWLTTVSETYAKEIQEPDLGFGMDGILRERSDVLSGIVNGIDYSVWDPESDRHLAAHYSKEDLSGKAKCKEALGKRLNLQVSKKVPLIGMVARLVDQKGLDLLARSMDGIMSRGLQMVILGSGQEFYERMLGDWQNKYPTQFRGVVGFDPALAHQIEAGSDVYMMPSRFEPCGLNQLYSLRYGTPPIVYATGGLVDTVKQISDDGGEGTGFRFHQFTQSALLGTIDFALSFYQKPKIWEKICKRAMNEDVSHKAQAVRYETLYQTVLDKKAEEELERLEEVLDEEIEDKDTESQSSS